MVLDMDGKSLDLGIERRALRYSPRLERAADLQAQIVVQTAGVMPLHDKAVIGRSSRNRRRFRRLREISLSGVVLQGHRRPWKYVVSVLILFEPLSPKALA